MATLMVSFDVSASNNRVEDRALCGALRPVHRCGRVGKHQELQRLAVGDERTFPVAGGPWRRELDHEVAIVAAAMRNDDDVARPVLDFDDCLEIARRRVFLRRELDVAGMLGLLRADEVRRGRHALERCRRVDLHVDGQARAADAA